MDECTFHPTIEDKSKIKKTNSKKVNGYDQVIQRVRTAAEYKRNLQEKIDQYFSYFNNFLRACRGEHYEELKKKEIKPFSFNRGTAKPTKKPQVVIELTVMPGKTSRIPLRPNDDPEEVVKNFSKIYHLSKEDQDSLRATIKDQLAAIQEKAT